VSAVFVGVGVGWMVFSFLLTFLVGVVFVGCQFGVVIPSGA